MPLSSGLKIYYQLCVPLWNKKKIYSVWSSCLNSLFDKLSCWSLLGLLTWKHMGESKEGWIFLGNVSLKLFFLGGFYEIDLIALTIRTGQKCSSQCISVFQNIFWVFHLAIRFDTLVVVKEQWLWTNVWVFTVECKSLLCAALSIRASFLPIHLDVQKKNALRAVIAEQSKSTQRNPKAVIWKGNGVLLFRSSSPTPLSSGLRQQGCGCGLHICKWISCFPKDCYFSVKAIEYHC